MTIAPLTQAPGVPGQLPNYCLTLGLIQCQAVLFDRKSYSDETLLALYKALLKPRLIEEKMLILLRQGKVSKWFSGMGRKPFRWAAPWPWSPTSTFCRCTATWACLRAATCPLDSLFAQWQGKPRRLHQGPRPQSFHFGTNEHHIVGMISHLGPQLAVADGIALADLLAKNQEGNADLQRRRRRQRRRFPRSPERGRRVAAAGHLPRSKTTATALARPSREQFRFRSFIDKGPAYGMEAVQVDGNNVLEVYDTVSAWPKTCARTRARCWWRPLPSGCAATKKPAAPSTCRRNSSKNGAGKTPCRTTKWLLAERESPYRKADRQRSAEASRRKSKRGLKKPMPCHAHSRPARRNGRHVPPPTGNACRSPSPTPPQNAVTSTPFPTACGRAWSAIPTWCSWARTLPITAACSKSPRASWQQFGKERVRNTPLCESAIVGAGLGLSRERQQMPWWKCSLPTS